MPFSPQDPVPPKVVTEAQSPLPARESSPQDTDQLEGLFSLLRDLELEVAESTPPPPPSSPPPAATNGKAASAPPPPLTIASGFDLEEDFWRATPLYAERKVLPPDEAAADGIPWTEAEVAPLSVAESPASTSLALPLPPDEKGEAEEEAFKRLRNLLSELLVGESDYQVGDLEARLQHLESQVSDPDRLGNLLLPLLASLLERKVNQDPEGVIQALLPIVDRAIARKSQTDKAAMSLALAAALPGALSKQIGDAPEEVVQALAPVMGRALREQVRLDREAIVDALYPAIGHTVSKYMGEVVRQINQRVEETFSLRGLSRKLRARLRGVSEAELILSEAMPFSVQAVFLIHKTSGLVMIEVQRDDRPELEADMLAGMLTAIRSFASECTINPGKTSELTEVDYDDFKIVMEVAGYCYIAAVTQGEPPKTFVNQLRQTLSAIILNYGYGELIAEFNGDPDSIPQAARELLENLLHSPEASLRLQQRQLADSGARRSRWGAALAWTVLIGLLGLPFALYGWQHARRQQLAAQAIAAIAADPHLAVYQVDAAIAGNELRLQGKLPNAALSERAVAIAMAQTPDRFNVVNQLQTVNPPPDPGTIQAEIARLTQTFNQMQGIQIRSRYESETNRVIVEGDVNRGENARLLTQAFEQIPGVSAAVLALATDQNPIQQRIYFDTNSTFIDPYDLESKLMPIRNLLTQYPELRLKIIGHTDRSGSEQRNRVLAPQRANVVKQALVANGIAADRLETSSSIDPPPGVRPDAPLWLSRTARFEPIAPAGAN